MHASEEGLGGEKSPGLLGGVTIGSHGQTNSYIEPRQGCPPQRALGCWRFCSRRRRSIGVPSVSPHNSSITTMKQPLGILDLLQLRGFDLGCRTKFLRHQDKRYDVLDLLRQDWLDAYQSIQSRPILDGFDYVVSFVGLRGTRARFVGVYKVLGRRPADQAVIPYGSPFEDWRKPEHYFYELQRVSGFEDLEHRLVIDWGRAAIAWHQKASNKEILEILPKGQFREPFEDYLEFKLTYSELKYLVAHQEANKEWRARLSAVASIYLVLASTTGEQYVGSAYGTDGIWGRWSFYVRDGHGGNSKLRALIDTNAAYPENFTYSVLQILPRTLSQRDVLKWESRFKEKLGSRATGLNLN